MRMLIAAIGRLKKKSPEDQLIEEYIRKTRWPVTVRESEEKKALSGDALKEAESRLLLGNVPTGAKVVALDERGEMLSSTELARKIAHWRDAGTQDVAFLIGGANDADASHGTSTHPQADACVTRAVIRQRCADGTDLD